MDADLVDWDLAVATARRLLRPGPVLPLAEAAAVVADLRRLAAEADEHVQDYTQLAPADRTAPVTVVDRPEWVRSNLAGLRVVTEPLLDKLAVRSRGRVSTAVGRRVTGVQLGSALAYLASKVLGQYEVFLPPDYLPAATGASATATGADTPSYPGRLSLVAPNIVHVEQALRVDPRDFRMWVCLHEQTHRAQFTAVPWLRGHLEGEIGAFIAATDLDPTVVAERMRSALAALRGAVRERDGSTTSVVEALQTPAQRVVLDRLQALMTLLEGHADQVMDAVGPKVVPSVKEIRGRFESRRGGGSPIDRFIRRLLGLDLKLQQYRQGGAFVRAVVAETGVAGFNRVWESPATLPTRAELTDPGAWIQRVHGSRPAVSA